MKISCIGLNSNLINSNEQIEVIKYLNKKLYEIGENVSLISYFDNNLDKLKTLLQSDNNILFFVGNSQVIYNHNIKDNLSRIFGEKLQPSDVCYGNLRKYCEDHNIPFSMKEEMEVMLPTNSIPLISKNNYNNGFMYKYNEMYIIFVPDSLEFIKENYINYILPLINDLINIKLDYQVIKCFGILEKDIKIIINDYYNIPEISINIIGDDLDNAIYIRYNSSSNFAKIQEIMSDIISKLNKYIYSLEDESIYKMAIDLLSVQHKKLIIAETITLGNITRKLCEIDNSNIYSSKIFVNYNDIINTLDISKSTITDYGKYSVNTVYEFSNSLLESNPADIVLFALGDNSSADNICFMAVGDLDGIHVYKNKINIKDDKTIENLSKTAVFYLIKKLKQNDLHFI